MNEGNNFRTTIKNNYKETDDGTFSYLSILLTPMNYLKSDERFARANLYQTEGMEVNLNIVHDKFNEKDNKALEVYYDKTFIGYIRKRFSNEEVDNTEIVNEFCFNGHKLRDIEIIWDGESFNIKQESRYDFMIEKASILEAINSLHYVDLNNYSEIIRAEKELMLLLLTSKLTSQSKI